jgi:hypothetical protein
MTDIIDELVNAAEKALAANNPENEVMALIQGTAWARIYGIKLSKGGATVELTLDEEGQSQAMIATTSLIGIKSIPRHNITVGF